MRDCLIVAVLLALVTACADRPRQEAASPEQIALVRASLNSGYEIRRAYAVAEERGPPSYQVTAYVYGPGLKKDLPITWGTPGPKHAPKPGLLQSRIPIEFGGVLNWGKGYVRADPEEREPPPEGPPPSIEEEARRLGWSWEEMAMLFVGIYRHGNPPASHRRQVLADSTLLHFYADLLAGRRTTAYSWSAATALRWLLETGDPKYVPLFVRYAEVEEVAPGLYPAHNEYRTAVAGLVLHAHMPAARDKLLQLGRMAPPEPREALVQTLLDHPTPATREVLQQVSLSGLPEGTRKRVGEVLRARAGTENH